MINNFENVEQDRLGDMGLSMVKSENVRGVLLLGGIKFEDNKLYAGQYTVPLI